MLKSTKRYKGKEGTLVPHWIKKELDIWLNKIEPNTPLEVFPFGSIDFHDY